MAIPTSSTFNLCDWNERATLAAPAIGGAIGAPADGLHSQWLFAGPKTALAVDTNTLAIGASSTHVTSSQSFSGFLPLAVPASFTFEFDVTVTEDLPVNWSDKGNRLFVGVKNKGGFSAGLFFTKSQLLLATDIIDDNPIPLTQSSQYLFDDDGNPRKVTIRIIVEALTKRVLVYIDPTSSAYDQSFGSNWRSQTAIEQRYNQPLRAYVADTSGLLIAGNTTVTTGPSIYLHSIRVANTMAYPALRPIADAQAQLAVGTNAATQLVGTGSFDKNGLTLTYDWTIAKAPLGSTALLQGASFASAKTGSATAGDVVVTYKKATSAANLFSLVITKPNAANQEFSYAFDGKTLAFSCATNNVSANVTTPAAILSAFKSPVNAAYKADIADLFAVDIALAGAAGDLVVPVGTYAFSGGAGSTLSSPILIPDVPGQYVVSLVVNNGVIRSVPTTRTIQVADVVDDIGPIPNTEMVFKYLPDFWNIVQGKEALPTLWSALAQVISGTMLEAWQHDYSKSIRDIARTFRRRYFSHDTWVALPEAYAIVPAVADASVRDVLAVVAENSSSVSTKTATVTVSAQPLRTGKVLLRASGHAPKIVTLSGLLKVNSTTWQVTTSDLFPIYEVLTSNTAGTLVGSDATSDYVTSKTYNMREVLPGDRVHVLPPGKTGIYAVNSKSGDLARLFSIAPSAPAALPNSGYLFPWQHLRRVVTTRVSAPAFFSYEKQALAKLGIQPGDLLAATIVDPFFGVDLEVHLPILAVDSNSIFVDWTTLLAYLKSAAGKVANAQEWTEANVATLVSKVTHIVRAKKLAKVNDLTDEPYLSASTTAHQYVQNRDYVIKDGIVEFLPLVTGFGAVSAGSTTVPLTSSVAVDKADPKIAWITKGPNAGFYRCSKYSNGVLHLIDTPAYTDVSSVLAPRFHNLAATPRKLWAEVALFDNSQNIENNFGLYVGVPKHLFDDVDVPADYLSVVKSLVVAYMSGPHVDRIGLVADAFVGLPFTEHRGQVLHIEPPTSSAGFIIYRDEFGRNVTYTYPVGSELADHPTSGKAISAFPIIAEDNQLSAQDVELKKAATLPAYTRLTKSIVVADMVSHPDVVLGYLESRTAEQEKNNNPPNTLATAFHTFVVKVPISPGNTTAWFSLLKPVLKELRPAYTDVAVIGAVSFVTDVPLTDKLVTRVRLRPKTVPHSPPMAMAGNAAPNSFLYPDAVLTRQFNDGMGTAADKLERYESWFNEGVVDDYSGDGSFNSAHRQVDQVNQLDNNDIDVLGSLVWVPVRMVTDANEDNPEFILGEQLRIATDSGIVSDTATYCGVASPPVIAHVGLASHPKIPFATYSQQHLHPRGYLVLGFDRPQVAGSLTDVSLVKANYGNILRLNTLAYAAALGQGSVYVIGVESGAKALVAVAPDLNNAQHAKYFHLERIFRADKLTELNPECRLAVTVHKYVGTTGRSYDSLLAGTADSFALGNYVKQVQMHPYDPAVAANQQFVPSYLPGFFAQHLNAVGADLVAWGYTDVGELPVSPTDITAFTKDPVSTAIKNVHLPIVTTSKTWKHFTHGLVQGKLPAPVIYLVRANVYAVQMRVEGYHFVARDASQIGAPNATPSSFSGTDGGCWVFVSLSNVETAADNVVFEQGTNAGQTVLGLDNTVQTSTGHVLNVTLPNGLPAGNYDVIVRNYRPYKHKAGGAQRYHMDEARAARAYTVA